jgi:Rrf2 family protein
MKISAQEEYGLRCLLQLARAGAGPDNGQKLSTRQIAEREGLTLDYAAQIMGTLRRAGFVVSVRGVHGGFGLARPASDISVGELLRSGEGPFADSICDNYTGTRETCMHSEGCNVAPVWAELARRIFGFLDDVTLADILTGDVAAQPQVVPLGSLRKRSRPEPPDGAES